MKEVRTELTIPNRFGMHTRPCLVFVDAACQFKSEIIVEAESMKVDGKSIMQMHMLAGTACLSRGSKITIYAVGDDADEAIAALTDTVQHRLIEIDEQAR